MYGGQRFTFIPGLGAIHIECLAKKVLEERSRDKIAYLHSLEALLYAIVRIKDGEAITVSDEARNNLIEVRREVERLAGRLSKLLTP